MSVFLEVSGFLENLLPELTLMKHCLADLGQITVEEKVYQDNDSMGEKNGLNSEALKEAFRKSDEAFRCFCKMVLFELAAQEVKCVILC